MSEEPQGLETPDFGRYKLIRRVSIGGTSEIFKAKAFGEQGFEKVVALKRLLPHAEEHPEVAQMFVNEGRLAAQLDHRLIARIYELGRVRGSSYIAMEYVYGRDLQELMSILQPLGLRADPLLVVAIAVQAAEALAYAHGFVDARGVRLQTVHRDISPQNLMIEPDGGFKLVDFGIAWFVGRDAQTAAGSVKGKQSYMSPEQVRRERLDGRSDLFSLGIVMWELLVGQRLFKADSPIDTLARVEAADVPPLADVAPDVPADLARWVMRCLERDRTDRPSDAETLQRGLSRVLTLLSEEAPRALVARAYAALFGQVGSTEDEVTLDEYRQALRAVELGEDPALKRRNPSDITLVPDTADLRAYLASLHQHLPVTEPAPPADPSSSNPR